MATEFFAGMCGGAAGIVVGQPFDTLKVLQQTDVSGKKTLYETFRKSVSKNGYLGLFDGMATPLIGNLPLQAVLFGCYGTGLRVLQDWRSASPNGQSEQQPLVDHLLAGTFTGVVQWPIATAVELAKIQIQHRNLQSRENRAYRGSVDAAKQIYKQYGMRTLMRGGTITLARDVFYGVYFLVYEGVRRAMNTMLIPETLDGVENPPNKVAASASVLIAGALAGVIGWAVIIPIDTIKTRIQAEAIQNPVPRMFDVARDIHQQSGAKGFLRGVGPVVLRAAPCNMVTFGVYELVLHLLGGHDDVLG